MNKPEEMTNALPLKCGNGCLASHYRVTTTEDFIILKCTTCGEQKGIELRRLNAGAVVYNCFVHGESKDPCPCVKVKHDPGEPAKPRCPNLEPIAREIARKGYHWLGHGEETAVKAILEIAEKFFPAERQEGWVSHVATEATAEEKLKDCCGDRYPCTVDYRCSCGLLLCHPGMKEHLLSLHLNPALPAPERKDKK